MFSFFFQQYRSQTKEMGMTDEQYARSVCNLAHPPTPSKKLAVVEEIRHHNVRELFVAAENEHVLDPLEELGIDVIETEDVDDEADDTEVDRTNPIHRKVEVGFCACVLFL